MTLKRNYWKSIGKVLLALIVAAQLSAASGAIDPRDDDVKCLALNIYHEARNESLVGQIAVALVVVNRVDSSKYPDDVCSVIKQGPVSKWHLESTGKIVPVRNKCQFSWYCDGKADDTPERHAWLQSVTLATAVLDGIYPDITEGALWYHADYVTPRWMKGVKYVTQIDRHIFYSEYK
jgi:spore germination cell wall hydrolase CwlJ-like protein